MAREEIVDGFGVGDMLLFENAGGEGFGGVTGEDRASSLVEDGSFVVPFADEMDGTPACLGSCGEDSAVHMDAVHALAAETGEESGVDVEDAIGEGLDDFDGEKGHVAGEANELDFMVLESLQEGFGVVGVFGGNGESRSVERFGGFGGGGVYGWGDDEGDLGGEIGFLGGADDGGHV